MREITETKKKPNLDNSDRKCSHSKMTWWKSILGCKNASKANILNIGMEFSPCAPNSQCPRTFFFLLMWAKLQRSYSQQKRQNTIRLFTSDLLREGRLNTTETFSTSRHTCDLCSLRMLQQRKLNSCGLKPE